MEKPLVPMSSTRSSNAHNLSPWSSHSTSEGYANYEVRLGNYCYTILIDFYNWLYIRELNGARRHGHLSGITRPIVAGQTAQGFSP
jgi:hypothetical protein